MQVIRGAIVFTAYAVIDALPKGIVVISQHRATIAQHSTVSTVNTPMRESHKRSWAKAIAWRIIATLIALVFVDLTAAIALNIIQTLAYYVHERLWIKIPWGREP